ncbi:MAG: ABC transporter permease, partial [Ezakiella sp.]
AILFGVLVNMLATLSVVLSSLRENAASLMRPKPPKKVKKMLIEKINFIWNRLGFIGKVTMRNVFRYKSRMFMTIFGIAGCTGLLFLGFSLREALGGIESRQFEKIMKYDFQIVTDEMLGDEGRDDYLKFLKSDDVKGYMNAYTQSFTYENENGRDQQVALVVPENKEEFDEYIELFVEKQFKKDRYYELDGIMITKKLGEIRPRGKSDIELRDSDLVETKIIPDGVVDNYIGHFVFMPKEIYEQKFNKKYETNSYYIKLNDLSKKDSIIADLRKNKSILSVVDFTEGKMAIDNWTTSVAAVVYIIIICSSILAMVVLYNLSNINIEERKRELSTIKVLGFTNKELSEYIYRETYILTVIGILAGFLVGWGMLIAVAEILPPDNIILNTIISFRPYLYSALISLFFTFVVEFIVRRRLKTIDMVSSLKAYE